MANVQNGFGGRKPDPEESTHSSALEAAHAALARALSERDAANAEVARLIAERDAEAALFERRIAERTEALRNIHEATEARLDHLPAALFISDWSAIHRELVALQQAGHRDLSQLMRDDPGQFEKLFAMRRNLWTNQELKALYGFEDSDSWFRHYAHSRPSDHELYHVGDLLEHHRVRFRSRETRVDGSTFDVLWTVIIPDGDWSRLTGVGEDVTEEVQFEEMMSTILREVSEGISLMDADLNLHFCNDRFYELLDFPRDRLPPGTNLAEFFRYNAQRGEYGPGDAEALVEERLALARQHVDHQFVRQRGDRLLRVAGRALPDGRFVTVYSDITEHAELEQWMTTILSSVNDGISLVDADLNVRYCNDRFYELLGFPRDRLPPGTHLAEFFRYNALRGEYGPGDVDQLVEERLALARQGNDHQFVRQRGDRILRVTGRALPDGGFVTAYSDITEQEAEREARELDNARKRQTLEGLNDGVLRLDGQLRVEIANGTVRDLLGLPMHTELEGRLLPELLLDISPRAFSKTLLEATIRQMLATAAHGEVKTQRLWRNDGRCIEFELVSDDRLGRVLVLTDVTSDGRLNRQLSRRADLAESRFQQLLETSELLFLNLDHEGYVVDSNETANRLLRRTPGEAIRVEHYLSAANEEDRNNLHAALDEVYQGLPSRQVEVSFTMAGGDEEVVLFTPMNSDTRTGPEPGVLLIGTCVTAVRDAERRLVHASKLATLGEMSAAIAHEISQPLNVINLAASNLAKRMPQDGEPIEPGVVLPKVEKITKQVARAKRITDHLRRFARAPDQRLEVIDVTKLVVETADLFGEQLRVAEIELRLSCAEECRARGNAGQLEQVVTNLLSNARDQLRDGDAVERWIELSVTSSGDCVQVAVEDSGGGIPDHVLPKLFEAYYTTKPAGVGTGLGLSLARDMIGAMNGTLTADNRPSGARFTITLPLAD